MADAPVEPPPAAAVVLRDDAPAPPVGDEWASILASYPAVLALPTLHRIPRGLDRRYARLRVLTLQWMCTACETGQPLDVQLAFARLAWAFPWAALHDPRAARPRDEPEADAPSVRAHVIQRLVLFETGHWEAFLQQPLDMLKDRPCRIAPASAPADDAAPHLDPHVVERACERALDGSLKAAVRLLLGSQPLPPTADTVSQVLSLYPTEGEPAALPPLSEDSRRTPPHTVREVSHKLRTLRSTAAPGPSGERNSHLKVLPLCPQGLAAVARWCTAWTAQCLHPAVRQIFLGCLIVPLDKGGGKARPIVLQEALLKIMTGIAVNKSQRAIERTVMPRQYGASGLAGAARMTWAVRAAMAQHPDRVFIGTDMRNAFGTMRRAYAFAEASSAAPPLAACLRALWAGASPRMLLDGPDGIEEHRIIDALCQGGCDAAPAFCLGINRFLRNVTAACTRNGHEFEAWAYVDDIVLAVAPASVTAVMAAFDEEARVAGLERRANKCSWYSPSGAPLDISSDVGCPAPLGLSVLGSVADGAYSTVLRATPPAPAPALAPAPAPAPAPAAAAAVAMPASAEAYEDELLSQVLTPLAAPRTPHREDPAAARLTATPPATPRAAAPAPESPACAAPAVPAAAPAAAAGPSMPTAASQLSHAQARARAAYRLLDTIRGVLSLRTSVAVRHAMWRLLVGVVNEALSFDVCVLPPATSVALARPFDQAVDDVLLRLASPPGSPAPAPGDRDPVHVRALALARLPRANGGCGVLRVADRAFTAFLATVINNAPLADAPRTRELAGVTRHAGACLTWLRVQGVHLNAWGMPSATPPAAPLLQDALPAMCLPKRQREWWKLLGSTRAAALAKTTPWLHCQGGPEGGAWLNANRADVNVAFADDEFATALRLRLRLPVCARGPCSRQDAQQSRRCGAQLDAEGQHAHVCKLGGLTTAMHDACCRRLWHAARQAGAFALREQVIPELITPTRLEPRVDLETWGLANEARGLYDFTICAPFASRYEKQADPVATAEAGKRRKYPAIAGLAVAGIGMDVYGRCGPELTDTLERWADHARLRDLANGCQPRRWLHTWRSQLSAEVAKGTARMVILANRRPAPACASTRRQDTATARASAMLTPAATASAPAVPAPAVPSGTAPAPASAPASGT